VPCAYPLHSKRSSVAVPSTTVKAARLPDATPARGHAHLPPHPPSSRTASVHTPYHGGTSATGTAAASGACAPACSNSGMEEDSCYVHDENASENQENQRVSSVSNASRDSDGSSYTSFTQIKERPLSTDSHTVVRTNQA
jgi:hypothetical protein